MEHGFHGFPESYVAPRAGAWIEIGSPWCIIKSIPSLPVRERGLKFVCRTANGKMFTSLPVRERGLKSSVMKTLTPDFMSLPVRERGLKLLDGIVRPYDCAVAPRAGAWIEISCRY